MNRKRKPSASVLIVACLFLSGFLYAQILKTPADTADYRQRGQAERQQPEQVQAGQPEQVGPLEPAEVPEQG